MHLHCSFLEVRREEWFSHCIDINLDCIITDYSGQDMGNGTEDWASLLVEQEGCAKGQVSLRLECIGGAT